MFNFRQHFIRLCVWLKACIREHGPLPLMDCKLISLVIIQNTFCKPVLEWYILLLVWRKCRIEKYHTYKLKCWGISAKIFRNGWKLKFNSTAASNRLRGHVPWNVLETKEFLMTFEKHNAFFSFAFYLLISVNNSNKDEWFSSKRQTHRAFTQSRLRELMKDLLTEIFLNCDENCPAGIWAIRSRPL